MCNNLARIEKIGAPLAVMGWRGLIVLKLQQFFGRARIKWSVRPSDDATVGMIGDIIKGKARAILDIFEIPERGIEFTRDIKVNYDFAGKIMVPIPYAGVRK